MTPIEYFAHMSPAARRVAAQMVEGKTNAEIAAALDLSEKTIKGHLSTVYKVTECANARQFLVWYFTGTNPAKARASNGDIAANAVAVTLE
jgi:DNA-binding CsgD family transcriptional regulator